MAPFWYGLDNPCADLGQSFFEVGFESITKGCVEGCNMLPDQFRSESFAHG